MASDRKPGRPAFEPTDEQRRVVTIMAAGGMQQAQIAYAIGIARNTLEKHFREELDGGGAKAHGMVVANLYRQATKDDPRATSAAIFWTKTRLGWREPQSINVSLNVTDQLSEDELASGLVAVREAVAARKPTS